MAASPLTLSTVLETLARKWYIPVRAPQCDTCCRACTWKQNIAGKGAIRLERKALQDQNKKQSIGDTHAVSSTSRTRRRATNLLPVCFNVLPKKMRKGVPQTGHHDRPGHRGWQWLPCPRSRNQIRAFARESHSTILPSFLFSICSCSWRRA